MSAQYICTDTRWGWNTFAVTSFGNRLRSHYFTRVSWITHGHEKKWRRRNSMSIGCVLLKCILNIIYSYNLRISIYFIEKYLKKLMSNALVWLQTVEKYTTDVFIKICSNIFKQTANRRDAIRNTICRNYLINTFFF